MLVGVIAGVGAKIAKDGEFNVKAPEGKGVEVFSLDKAGDYQKSLIDRAYRDLAVK